MIALESLAALIRERLAPVQDAVRNLLRRGQLHSVQEGRHLQEVKIRVMDGDEAEAAEHYQAYGCATKPPKDALGLVGAVMGSATHLVAWCFDAWKQRPRDLEPGEVKVWSVFNQVIHFANDGSLVITAPAGIRIEAGGDLILKTSADLTAEADANLDLNGHERFSWQSHGHGYVLFPTYKDSYVIGTVLGNTYNIKPEDFWK